MKKILAVFACFLLVLSGCSSDDDSQTITVLIHRTDIVSTYLEEMATKYEEQNPGVDIVFEGLQDYDTTLTTRLSSGDYGDVLMIPGSLPLDEYGNYFEPLGTDEDISETYQYYEKFQDVDTVYGIPIAANAQGIVYNSDVTESAGITSYPETPEEFQEDLEKIEDTGITGLYSLYVDQWSAYNWTVAAGYSMSGGDKDWRINLLTDESPFSEGKPLYESMEMYYNAAANGSLEEDPFTSEFAQGQQLMADDEVGAMVLGSWTVPQIKELTDNPDKIKFGPYPYLNDDGEFTMEVAPDYGIAISKETDNYDISRDFVDFFLDDYATSQDLISPVIGAELPSYLSDEYTYTTANPLDSEQSARENEIIKASTINIADPGSFVSPIVEIGVGNRDESFDDYMESLNEKWQQAFE